MDGSEPLGHLPSGERSYGPHIPPTDPCTVLQNPESKEVLDRILQLAMRTLEAPLVELVILESREVCIRRSVQQAKPPLQKPSHSLYLQLIAAGSLQILEEAGLSILAAPVCDTNGRPIGMLAAIDRAPRPWTSVHTATLNDLAALVTAEINTRSQLQEAQSLVQRANHFINVSPIISYIFDIAKRRTIFLSKGTGSLSGYAMEQILAGDDALLKEMIHPEDYRQLPARIARFQQLQDGEIAVTEFRIRRKDNEWRWYLSRATVFSRDDSGKVEQIIGCALDITDRKLTEQALKESEERLELLVNAAELGTWEWNIETGEIIYNETWATMLDYRPEEIVPHFNTWYQLVHPEDIDGVMAAVHAHLEGHTPQFTSEHRLRAAGGTWKWILTSGKVIKRDAQGKPLHAAGIHLDITSRKEAEAAVHAADRKLARILESMIEACSSVDSQWRYTYVNPQWKTFFRLQNSETVIGRSLWECNPELLGTPMEELYRHAMETREPARREVFSPTLHRWMEIRIFPLADGSLSTFILDIHERKTAESVMRQHAQRKDDFLAMLGHELRNPLAAIRHALDIGNLSDDIDTTRWVQGVVGRQASHLSRLVDDLLDVARIARGKVKLRKETVDIATVLDRAVEATLPLVIERNHKLKLIYDHGKYWVNGDPSRLEQVIANLLTNSVKYTQTGGRITLETAYQPTPDGNGEVVISVTDTGEGIQPEKIETLFEPFLQGERSLARSEGGLGLGLTIVKEFTEMHGGRVTAHSDGLGRGSVFTVYLPCVPSPSGTKPPENESTAAAGKVAPRRILVVDDHPDVVEGLTRLLKRQGHIVEMATDGFTACEKAVTFRPELILLDIGLPGRDGYEVVQDLRKDPRCSKAFMVALTGYGQEEDRLRALQAGFDEHLVKPVSFERLRQIINDTPGLGESG